MKRKILFAGLLATLLLSGFVLAQEAVAEPEISLDQLLEMTGKVISDWRVLGWMAGIIALIALLVMALRFKPLNELLDRKDLKWIKTYVSAGLGALSGFFTAFQTGAGWVQSILLGLTAGWAVIGAHQTITKANRKKVK